MKAKAVPHMKENPGYRAFTVCNTIFLILVSLITIVPIYYVFSMSLRPEIDIIKYGQTFLPQSVTFDAFREIFSGDLISSAFVQTIKLTFAGTILSILCNILTAYPLSKAHLPGNRVISFLIYFTMLFGGGLIPYFLIVKALGLYNSLWALILGGAINPFNVLLFRNFFSAIPQSVEESAMIDGATEFVSLARIVLPLSLPVIATVTLMTSVGFWNEWFSALVFLNNSAQWPLQLVLRDILQAGLSQQLQQAAASMQAMRPQESLKMAVVVVSTVPIMIVYPFLQKYFIKGLTMGATKG